MAESWVAYGTCDNAYVYGKLHITITDTTVDGVPGKKVRASLYFGRNTAWSGGQTSSTGIYATVNIGESTTGKTKSATITVPAGEANVDHPSGVALEVNFTGAARNVTVSWSSTDGLEPVTQKYTFQGSGSDSISVPASVTSPARPTGTIDDIGTTDITPGKAKVTIFENNWGIGTGNSYTVIAGMTETYDTKQVWASSSKSTTSFPSKTINFSKLTPANADTQRTAVSTWYPQAHNGAMSSVGDAKYIASPSAPIVHVSPYDKHGKLNISMRVNYSGGTSNSTTADTARMRMWKTSCIVDDTEDQDTEATTIIPESGTATKTCEQVIQTYALDHSRTFYIQAVNQWGGRSAIEAVLIGPWEVSATCTDRSPTSLTLKCAAEMVGDASENVQWDPITYDSCYFRYSTDPGAFSRGDYITTESTTGYSMTIPGLVRNTTYYCQAVMVNNYGLTGESGLMAFTTLDAYSPEFTVGFAGLPDDEVGFKASVNISKAGGTSPDSDTITSVRLLANPVDEPLPSYKLIAEDNTGRKSVDLESRGILRPTSTMPWRFQELEYIESTGTQYIDTGLSLNSGYNVTATIDAQYSQVTTNSQVMLGGSGSTGGWYGQNGGVWCVSLEPQGKTGVSSAERLLAHINFPTVTDNYIRVFSKNGTELASYLNDNYGTDPLTVFKTQTFWSMAKLFSLKIKSDNSLVRNFVPAKAKTASKNLVSPIENSSNGVTTTGWGTNSVHISGTPTAAWADLSKRTGSTFDLLPNKTYTFSVRRNINYGAIIFRIYYTDGTGSGYDIRVNSGNNWKQTFTIPSGKIPDGTGYVFFEGFAVGTPVNFDIEYSVTESDTPSYEPYYKAGEVGLYDLIGERFYRNLGTGDFIAGPIVNDEVRGDYSMRVEVTNSTGITTTVDTVLRAPSDISLTDIRADGNRFWAMPHYTVNSGSLLEYYLYAEKHGEAESYEWGPGYNEASTTPVHSAMRGLDFGTEYDLGLIVYDTYGLANYGYTSRTYRTEPENSLYLVNGSSQKLLETPKVSEKNGSKKTASHIYHVKNNSIGSALEKGHTYSNLKLFFPASNAYYSDASNSTYIDFRCQGESEGTYHRIGEKNSYDPIAEKEIEVFGIFDKNGSLEEAFCIDGEWQETSKEFETSITVIEVSSYKGRGMNISPFFSQITCKFDNQG